MKYLVLVLICLPFLAYSQLSYEKVVEVDSTSKNILYNRAKSWVAKSLENPERAINLDDAESGTIILNLNFKYDCKLSTGFARYSGYISYNLELFFKENRYKFRFSNFIHPTEGTITESEEHPKDFKYKSERKYFNKLWKDIKLQIDTEVTDLSVLMEKEMVIPLESEKDW